MSAAAFVAALGAATLAWCGVRAIARERVVALVGRAGGDSPAGRANDREAWRRLGAVLRTPSLRTAVVSALLGGIGWKLVGPIGAPAGIGMGFVAARSWSRRAARARAEALERQLGEVSETVGQALRSGLSIGQALEFAATEAEPPMSAILDRFVDERRLGTPFDRALGGVATSLGTEDARLFALVVGTHARTGGDLAGALEAVTEAIRHRTAVRTELRALSAQGRVSGAIMGALPIVFCLVLATTSRRQLGPVYRSPAGILMLSVGLAMDGVAYLWIRRLLRIEG